MKRPHQPEVLAVLAAISQDPVDELGVKMAQAAPLNARIDELKQIIVKKYGSGVVEGQAFDAVVSDQPGRVMWDDEKVINVLSNVGVPPASCRKVGKPYKRVDVKAKR